MGNFFKNCLVKIPMNKLTIINSNGDISNLLPSTSLGNSVPGQSLANNKKGQIKRIMESIVFI